ncbi:MFS transporter [Paraburkholderia sp. SIMBA_053]|uniref:MFS transporter n=1 Tax=Paraburkholderia sp. SIMBA_053 TaxID=3085794 RepID=UPI0039783EAE
MDTTQQVELKDLINQQTFGRFLFTLVALCFTGIILDGFDISVMGLVAPALRQEWNLSHETLGWILSTALIGQTIGALIGGILSDRFGRKPVMVASVFCIGIWTLATGMADHVPFMIASRFFTGLGLGAIIPSTTALVAEYAPRRMKALLVTLTLCGFTVGAAGGGFLSAFMLPAHGWRPILVIGGVVPVLLGIVLMKALPESLSYLLSRGKAKQSVTDIVERMSRGHSSGFREVIIRQDEVRHKSAVKIVLASQYRTGTMLLCLADFCVLFLIFLFNSWLPTLVKENGGYSLSQSAIATSMFQLGGPVGSLIIGWAMDRWRPNAILTLNFMLAAFSVGAIGQVASHYAIICSLTFVAGFCLGGGSVGLAAFAAEFFPTEARATGTSWMLGLGRLGAILSALTGAAMLTLGWSLSQIFLALVIPALIVSLIMLALRLPRHLQGTGAAPVVASNEARIKSAN